MKHLLFSQISKLRKMIKYASNAFLAVKISFINEMALLAEKVGADVQKIASAMGQDGRISPKFLHAGNLWIRRIMFLKGYKGYS